MKIKINDIPQEGLTLEEERDAASLDLARDDLKFISPIKLSAFVTRDENEIYAHVKASGRIEAVCGRCLCSYAIDFNREFDFSCDITGKNSLDLTDDIRQEVILEYPLKTLCKADCRGLCQVCGKNLNDGDCGHKNDAQKWDKLEKN